MKSEMFVHEQIMGMSPSLFMNLLILTMLILALVAATYLPKRLDRPNTTRR